MSDLLEKSISRYPYNKKLHSYRGAARIIAAGNGQTISVFKEINGVHTRIAQGVAVCEPALILDVGIGASEDFTICVEGTNGDCLQLAVIDTNFTITPPVEIGEINVGDIQMGDVTVTNDCDNPVGVEVCGVDVVDCSASTGPQDPLMVQITDAGPSNGVFPIDYVNGIDNGDGGRPFGGFPFTDGPAANNKGYTFAAQIDPASLPDCPDVEVTRVYFEVVIQQLIDNDGPDFGDQISTLVTPSAVAIPTTGVTTTGVSNNLAGFVFFDPSDGVVSTFTLDATNPAALSLSDAVDSELAFATQAGDTTTILGVCKVVEYSLGESCALQSISTKECNSDASLSVLNDVSSKIDDLIIATQQNLPINYSTQINGILSAVQAIDADTTAIETLLGGVGTNTQNTVVELQNAITELQAIDANTDTVEQALADILAAIPTPTTVEAYGNEVLAAGESFTAPAGTYSIRITPEPGNTFDFAGLDEDFTAWAGLLTWGTGQRASSNSDNIVVTASAGNAGRVLVHWEV